MDWIKVEDMPEEIKDASFEQASEQYIINVVTQIGYSIGSAYVTTGRIEAGMWHWHEGRKLISKDFKVTHYCELPEPIHQINETKIPEP